MKQIRAFVGHSFAEADEAVVTTFLDYFDQLKSLLPAFDWVHARAAEPTELATKVLGLIEGRNTFIGICTNRERVVDNERLRKSVLTGRRSATENDLRWKTSDWVIQEIGLAIGRKMSLIMLLEEGCRRPGGLQGDLEFIPFSRSAPEKAFGRLLEMVSALAPNSTVGEAVSSDSQQEPASEDQPVSPPEQDLPNSSWDFDKFETAFAWRIIKGEEDEARTIDEAYRTLKEASDPAKLALWESTKEVWRLRMKKGGSLSHLRSLHEQFPTDLKMSLNLAGGLLALGLHKEAAQAYLSAAQLDGADPNERLRLRGLAAIQLGKDGQCAPAEAMLKSLRCEVGLDNKIQQLDLLARMKEFFEDSSSKYSEIVILERIVELEPEDWNSRFTLAFKYMDAGMHNMSLHHYLQIPRDRRSSGAWNNLGVCYQNLSMPAKSVHAYRTAAEMSETLAMSNLAYKYMNSGFTEEADAELHRALKVEDFHKNVAEAIAALKDIPEQEQKKVETVLKETDEKRTYFRELGRAVICGDVESLPDVWYGPDCELTLDIRSGVFTAKGSYERSPNFLASLGSNPTPIHHTIEYSGKVLGRRVIGNVRRTSDRKNQSTGLLSLGIGDDDVEVVMIFNASLTEIWVAERLSTNSPKFYRITLNKDVTR